MDRTLDTLYGQNMADSEEYRRYSPDISQPISSFVRSIESSSSPLEISASLIGSCTNSSYEDFSRANNIASQALSAGLKVKTEFLVALGSEEIRSTVERDGLFDDLREVGGSLLANACGAW